MAELDLWRSLFGGLACPGSGHSARSCAGANAPIAVVASGSRFSQQQTFALRLTSPRRRPCEGSSRSSSGRWVTRGGHQFRNFIRLAVPRNAGFLREVGRRFLDRHVVQGRPVLEVRSAPTCHHRAGQDTVNLNTIGDAAIGECLPQGDAGGGLFRSQSSFIRIRARSFYRITCGAAGTAPAGATSIAIGAVMASRLS